MTTTLLAGLFGQPLHRSLSAELFGIFARLTGEEISYEPREVPASSLASEIARAEAAGWSGFNVTIPHKAAVLSMLHLADPAAKAAGAVNTVRFGKRGLEGINTDARALVEIFAEKGINTEGRAAAVFGAGGAAGAAGWALGRSRAAEVMFCARNTGEASKLSSRLSACFPGTAFSVSPFTQPPRKPNIIINATPLGMYAPGMPPCGPQEASACLDMAYSAGGTEFIKKAEAGGAAAVSGLEILVWQAALSLKYWSGLPAGDIVEFKREALRLLREQLNKGIS